MRGKYLSSLVLLIVLAASNEVLAKGKTPTPIISRNIFPKDFIFGCATSAYQIEGAAHKDGRGPSIWDTFSEKYPERIRDGSNGSVAADSYHLYKEDVALLHEMGFSAYRFSISWSRILPRGDLKGGINQAGIDYYNKLINELLSKGIQPFATIFHWDTPQGLEDAYGGFRDERIVNDFRDYADLCFKHFGDRVKHWMTLNEQLTVVRQGYMNGVHAPGRCSNFTNPQCTAGDGGIEPYIVGHNLLLSHGAAVKAIQKGQIGTAIVSGWHMPYEETAADKLAVARAMAFSFDYFMEPLVTGQYPRDMVKHVKGGRLPTFTPEQSKMLIGSYDFVGVNYYFSIYTKDVPCTNKDVTLFTDPCANLTGVRKGVSLPTAASDWLYIHPQGIRELILYVKYKFKDPIMYITENGRDEFNHGEIRLHDEERIEYYKHHLWMVREAIALGAHVKGYFAWSLVDNFEWEVGYAVRFGLVFVDFNDGCKRYLKDSAKWFKSWLKPKYGN
ncbi:unnamed protein product [Thlaspi arvense]|uniref:Beta-glucosidase n=1 Tax=Thlaspi arvense TaxID=13288 RepID=A0AAU9S9M6_THLAR|nr:unnamed protein product [Thlaspi arvense]